MKEIIIKNDALQFEFSPQNGSLNHLFIFDTGWKVINRRHLGLLFRLQIPSNEHRNNPVFSEDQVLGTTRVSDDQRHVSFTWDTLTSRNGDHYDIQISIDVDINNQGAIFKMFVDNRSDSIIENVYFPYFGDIQRPLHSTWFKTFSQHLYGAQERSIWPTFDNMRGYFSVDHPTQLHPAYIDGVTMWGPIPPFILLRGEAEGLYIGYSSPTDELVTWHLELHPGYTSMMNSVVPEETNIVEKEVFTRFSAVHVPFIMPNESRELTPIMVSAFQGSWEYGADIYKNWRDTWMTRPNLPHWVRDPHSWQEIQVNSPEDELRLPFHDLVERGEECARNNVSAIQLVGWNLGGQDGNIPFHDPDPRLGGEFELKRAIQKIQALGVKVVLFSKFTWADRLNPSFEEIQSSTIKDPYGDNYQFEGFQYQTITQLLDINTRRLIPMCFLDENYMTFCEREFTKLLALGVDGILFDCCLEHTPALLCFDRQHGHRYGAFVFANDREIIKRFAKIANISKQDFLFSGEAPYDWEYEAYHMGYIRSYRKDHIPLSRYLLPEVPIMTAITGFNDRHMVNQSLLYKYILSYEPYNFKGRLSDFPLTVGYGQKMDALRTELRDYFWDGEFRHEIGALVTVNGQRHHPYSVFRNNANGRVGVAIANYDDRNEIAVNATLQNGKHLDQYRLVDAPGWKPAASLINIPPASAAVVI